MSKAKKTASKIKRLKEKKARKEANKLKYLSWRDHGINQKSKRFLKTSGKKRASGFDHPNGACGNVGCARCFPGVHGNKRLVWLTTK